MNSKNLAIQVYDESTKIWYLSCGWLQPTRTGHLNVAVCCGSNDITQETIYSYSSNVFRGQLCRLINLQTLEVRQYLYNGVEVKEVAKPEDIITIDGRYYMHINH